MESTVLDSRLAFVGLDRTFFAAMLGVRQR